MLALEVHGVEADVHENVHVLAIGPLGADCVGVAGRERDRNRTGDGCAQLPNRRHDCHAVPQLALGKHRVTDRRKRHGVALERRHDVERLVGRLEQRLLGSGIGGWILGCVRIDAAMLAHQVAPVPVGRHEGDHERNDAEDQEGHHVIRADGDHADKARRTKRNCLDIKDRNQHCTNTGRAEADKEGPAEAQVDAEDGGFRDTKYGRDARGTS